MDAETFLQSNSPPQPKVLLLIIVAVITIGIINNIVGITRVTKVVFRPATMCTCSLTKVVGSISKPLLRRTIVVTRSSSTQPRFLLIPPPPGTTNMTNRIALARGRAMLLLSRALHHEVITRDALWAMKATRTKRTITLSKEGTTIPIGGSITITETNAHSIQRLLHCLGIFPIEVLITRGIVTIPILPIIRQFILRRKSSVPPEPVAILEAPKRIRINPMVVVVVVRCSSLARWFNRRRFDREGLLIRPGRSTSFIILLMAIRLAPDRHCQRRLLLHT